MKVTSTFLVHRRPLMYASVHSFFNKATLVRNAEKGMINSKRKKSEKFHGGGRFGA